MNVALLRDPDAQLEREIDRARVDLLNAWTPANLKRMNELILQRSPEQVRRLERERGLA